MPLRPAVRASFWLALGAAGCGTALSGSDQARESGRGSPPGGEYQVREAAEASDTDDLQIRLQHGVISADAAQEAVMRHWKELTACYGNAGPAMGFAGGSVTLRFVVDAQGTTTDARVVDTQLGNFDTEQCLVAIGRTIRFPRPHGNAVANIDYSLEFRSTGTIPVMELAEGMLDPQLPGLFARLHAACERLGADEVQATMYVDAAGKVRSVGLATASAGPIDEEAARCVSATIRDWTVRVTAVQGGVGRVMVPLRNVDLMAHREPSPEVRRYSRASATARARPRRRP